MSDIITAKIYKNEETDKIIRQPAQFKGVLDLSQFMDLMTNMLRMDRPDIIFAPSYPSYLVENSKAFTATMDNPTQNWVDTITHKVTRLEPRSVGGNKQPFDGSSKEARPRWRQDIKDVNEKTVSQIFGQMFDTYVQFDIWSITNTEAEELVNWFQDYMSERRGLWKHLGIGECLLTWRGIDDNIMNINKKLQTRTITFYIRYEQLTIVESVKLNELAVSIRSKYINTY